MKKNYIIFAIIILVIIVVFAFSKNRPINNQAKNPGNTMPQPNKVTMLDSKIVPSGFAADFPFEKDAKIIQNYVSENPQGTQYTRQFLSSKSLADNYNLYLGYLAGKNWTVSNKIDQKDIKAIIATNSRQTLSITISSDNVSKKIMVAVNLVQAKK